MTEFQKEQMKNAESKKQAVFSKDGSKLSHKRSLSVISGLTGSFYKINDPQFNSQVMNIG